MEKSTKNTKAVKPYIITSKQLALVKDKSFTPLQAEGKISCSKMAVDILRGFFDNDTLSIREEFHILVLNRANKIAGHSRISIGGTSGTVADGKLIFSTALLVAGSAGIVLCHNHPSGQLTPSDADLSLTRKMVEFGKMIDLPILDHIILTEEGYYSFADNGRIA